MMSLRLPLPLPLPSAAVRRGPQAAAVAVAWLSLHLLTAGPSIAADARVPLPAPGQTVPPHAAGGWPSETTGDNKRPGRTPEQQAAMESVAGELRRIANQYGPDSVVLQAKLLIRSTSAGAIGPIEVRVAGPSTGEAGPEHLEIDVETGLFFDEATTTAESRRETIWKDVAMPVLDEMASFKIDPQSLELVFLFDVQKIAEGDQPSPNEDARHEAFHVRLSREMLEDLVADRVVGDAMRDKAVLSPAITVARPARLP
jgi:hypothetical protein